MTLTLGTFLGENVATMRLLTLVATRTRALEALRSSADGLEGQKIVSERLGGEPSTTAIPSFGC